MRNKLLATVAMTALIGCTSFAVAQNAGTQGGAIQPPGAQQQHQMGGPSGGSAQNEATPSKPTKPTPKGEQGKGFSQENKSQPGAQGSASAPKGEQGSASAPKGEQGKTFSQEERNKSSQEEHNKSQPGAQGSAQEQRGSPNQRGAQEQRGKEEQRGAQMQREERGAQDKDRTQERTQERMGQDQDRGKTFQGQAQQGGGVTTGRPGRASVQLSEDQRVKIKDVIVRDRNVARINSASFSVSVGARVPRDVHVTVLPPEVVRIVPEYRGYEYVLIGDQLLIIDPDTMEIVAILPA
jgi:hypothetical protein